MNLMLYKHRSVDSNISLTMQNVFVGQHELFRQPKPGGFSYVVPNASDVDVYRDGIDMMPDSEGPEIFGLHTNADISCRTQQVALTSHHRQRRI